LTAALLLAAPVQGVPPLLPSGLRHYCSVLGPCPPPCAPPIQERLALAAHALRALAAHARET